MNNFQFDYEGIIPLNYKGKQNINDDLDEILKNTINTTIDWKKRESSIKKLGQICLGDQGNSDIFIKTFNGQLATNLGIQMADLRSSVMKEACRITSLCAKELGIAIEQGATYLLTQYVLFKIAGSANRVISDSSSKCILNLVKYVNSIKVISNICEQKSMKSNFVRNICGQCILYIVTCYKKNLLLKTNKILEDSMKSLLSDANGEVRATTRRAFITYRKRFQDEGDELFDNLEKNVQKQIVEDEKKYGDSIIVDSEDGGEINFENSKNKSYLYGTSSKPKSHEVKYNNKDNINIDKPCSTFQKEFKSEELNYNENDDDDGNDIESNIYSKQFSDTTEFSENLQNEKNEEKANANLYTNMNQNTNTNINTNKLKAKGNKSFKGKETVNPNNAFAKTTKLNNKELLKKLNDKFYNSNLQNSENTMNNNYINSNDTNLEKEKEKEKNNYEQQKTTKQYNTSLNKRAKPKKIVNKSNNINNTNNTNNINNISNNNNNQNNNNDINNNKNIINSNNYTQNKQQTNNISTINKTNNSNINNYIQNNSNINDNFNININKDSMEYKIIDKINQLSIYNNIKEKIKIFQYLFNSFNDILTDVNNISDITLRQFVDVHIEYIIYEDKALTEQLIKNLMRMIFYMTQIFTSNDIRLIVKILMIKINIGEKSISKLSYELLDLIRKKWKIEDIYNGIFSLLEEKKIGYNDVCYEYLTLLVIYCGSIFEDINYFRKIIEIICIGDMNSKKIGKLIEALYKNNQKNFVQVLQEQNYENQKKLLFFLQDKIDSIYNEVKQNQNEIQKNNNNNTSGKIKKNIDPKANAYNNNELDEIKKYIENGNVKSFLDYLDDNRAYLPKFLMLLTDEKYSNPKYIKNILNFIYSLISMSDNLSRDLSQNMEILIDQLINFLLMNINNSFIVDMVKEIFNIIPSKINSEKYYKSISKYLNNQTNVILLQNLLMCIKNNIINEKSKNLEKQLPFFINGILNLLNHPSSDVRKYAVYCCVELYMVLEHKFDVYLEMLPKSQQNLINLFIKKKNG